MTKHQSEPNAHPASDGGSSEWPTMNDIRIHEAVKKWSEPADSTPAQPASEAVIPSLLKCCMMPAPDNTGRRCDKPAGHDGPHWTYGMDGKEWPAASEASVREAELRQLFQNKFSLWANEGDVMAMDEDRFVEVVSELLDRKAGTDKITGAGGGTPASLNTP
jgi:hypothetical protein